MSVGGGSTNNRGKQGGGWTVGGWAAGRGALNQISVMKNISNMLSAICFDLKA